MTVVGAGGVGKTRLAIEVARSVLGGYRDGTATRCRRRRAAPSGESRAIARLHDHATLDAALEEGHRDPQAVLKLAAQRSAPGADGTTVAG